MSIVPQKSPAGESESPMPDSVEIRYTPVRAIATAAICSFGGRILRMNAVKSRMTIELMLCMIVAVPASVKRIALK